MFNAFQMGGYNDLTCQCKDRDFEVSIRYVEYARGVCKNMQLKLRARRVGFGAMQIALVLP